MPTVKVRTRSSTAGPTGFGDAKLNTLIAEALLYNPDLLVAAARVEAAAQSIELADSKLYPQVNALARGGGPMGGDASGLQGGGHLRGLGDRFLGTHSCRESRERRDL